MRFTIDSTAHRVNRLHVEFENFEEACRFFNKVARRPVSIVYLTDCSSGEVLVIKTAKSSKTPVYYSESYKQLVHSVKPYRQVRRTE